MFDERQVEVIVGRALRRRLPLWARFVRLARALGWAGLLGGAGVRVAGALVAAVVIGVLGVAVAPGSAVGILAIAPVLVLLLSSLVDAAEKVGPLAGLRGSTLFTVAEVTAIRVVGYAACGFVFAVVMGASSATAASVSGIGLIAEGCAAVSVSAAVVVLLLQHGWERLVLVLPAVWGAAVLLPAAVSGRRWEAALQVVPIPVWAGVVVIGSVLFGVVDARTLRPGRGVLRAAGV